MEEVWKNVLWRHIGGAYNLEVSSRGQIELSPARKCAVWQEQGSLKAWVG